MNGTKHSLTLTGKYNVDIFLPYLTHRLNVRPGQAWLRAIAHDMIDQYTSNYQLVYRPFLI